MKYLLMLALLFTGAQVQAASCTGNCISDGVITVQAILSDAAVTSGGCFKPKDPGGLEVVCTSGFLAGLAALEGAYTYYPISFTLIGTGPLGATENCDIEVVYAEEATANFPNTYTGVITTGAGADITGLTVTKTISLLGQTPIVGAGKVTFTFTTTATKTCSALQAVSALATFRMVKR